MTVNDTAYNVHSVQISSNDDNPTVSSSELSPSDLDGGLGDSSRSDDDAAPTPRLSTALKHQKANSVPSDVKALVAEVSFEEKHNQPDTNQMFSYGFDDTPDLVSEMTSPKGPLHWDRLRDNFAKSSWARNVNDILKESLASESDIPHLDNPAEVFYNTAMDIYQQDVSFDEFLSQLRSRLDSVWDDRLEHPASVFFTTAETVTSVVGAGKIFGGALRYGQATFNSAIDQIIERWQMILGVTEDAVDKILPEVKEYDADDEEKNEELFLKKRGRGVTDIYSKVRRRVKQRIPTFASIRMHVKEKLDRSYWFQKVDDILLQNVLLRSLGDLMRPAEHFYDTAMSTFDQNRQSLSQFVNALRERLGNAWDDRLEEAACEFYESATDISDTEIIDD